MLKIMSAYFGKADSFSNFETYLPTSRGNHYIAAAALLNLLCDTNGCIASILSRKILFLKLNDNNFH